MTPKNRVLQTVGLGNVKPHIRYDGTGCACHSPINRENFFDFPLGYPEVSRCQGYPATVLRARIGIVDSLTSLTSLPPEHCRGETGLATSPRSEDLSPPRSHIHLHSRLRPGRLTQPEGSGCHNRYPWNKDKGSQPLKTRCQV